jgi:hypothetical protein
LYAVIAVLMVAAVQVAVLIPAYRAYRGEIATVLREL